MIASKAWVLELGIGSEVAWGQEDIMKKPHNIIIKDHIRKLWLSILNVLVVSWVLSSTSFLIEVISNGTIVKPAFTSCIKWVSVGLSEGRSVPSRSLQPAGVVFPSLPRMLTTHGHQVRCSDNVWKVFFSISCKTKSQIIKSRAISESPFASVSKQEFRQNHSYQNVFRLYVDVYENELISREKFCRRACSNTERKSTSEITC